ncbi:MAG: hypothetical protein ACE5I1_27025, partial [bacterium]
MIVFELSAMISMVTLSLSCCLVFKKPLFAIAGADTKQRSSRIEKSFGLLYCFCNLYLSENLKTMFFAPWDKLSNGVKNSKFLQGVAECMENHGERNSWRFWQINQKAHTPVFFSAPFLVCEDANSLRL